MDHSSHTIESLSHEITRLQEQVRDLANATREGLAFNRKAMDCVADSLAEQARIAAMVGG